MSAVRFTTQNTPSGWRYAVNTNNRRIGYVRKVDDPGVFHSVPYWEAARCGPSLEALPIPGSAYETRGDAGRAVLRTLGPR